MCQVKGRRGPAFATTHAARDTPAMASAPPTTAAGHDGVPAFLTELRLTAFKSFSEARLPLGDLTLLIGRNGSGKSNALEALEVLARLAGGDDIRDVIDGSRVTGSPIRGGVAGCAPYGEQRFALGCTVGHEGGELHYDVEIAVEPDVQVFSERLWRAEGGGGERDLLVTDRAETDSADIWARYDSGRRGPNPAASFRASRLLITQVATRVPGSTKAMRAVHDAAATVVAALRAIFVLDPVPQEMREYVPERDAQLRRQADNLSAVVARLRDDPTVWDRMRTLVKALPEQDVDDITVERSPLGDVILALHERHGGADHPVSARMMSDGMLPVHGLRGRAPRDAGDDRRAGRCADDARHRGGRERPSPVAGGPRHRADQGGVPAPSGPDARHDPQPGDAVGAER